MRLSELIELISETQAVSLMGEGIESAISSDAATLAAVLNEAVLDMKVTAIEAEDSVVKVWVEVSG